MKATANNIRAAAAALLMALLVLAAAALPATAQSTGAFGIPTDGGATQPMGMVTSGSTGAGSVFRPPGNAVTTTSQPGSITTPAQQVTTPATTAAPLTTVQQTTAPVTTSSAAPPYQGTLSDTGGVLGIRGLLLAIAFVAVPTGALLISRRNRRVATERSENENFFG